MMLDLSPPKKSFTLEAHVATVQVPCAACKPVTLLYKAAEVSGEGVRSGEAAACSQHSPIWAKSTKTCKEHLKHANGPRNIRVYRIQIYRYNDIYR